MEKITHLSDLDPCVQCGRKTPYGREMAVDIRENYVPGMGQFCKRCLRIMSLPWEADSKALR